MHKSLDSCVTETSTPTKYIVSSLCLTLGPLIGSELYKLGGFTLPFYSVGAFATVMSFALCVFVPNVKDDDKDGKDKKEQDQNQASFLSLLKVSWWMMATAISSIFHGPTPASFSFIFVFSYN